MSEPGICFVCGDIYPLLANLADLPVVGGAEVQQVLIGQGLRERGFAVSYVTEEYGQGPQASVQGFRVLSFRLGRNKVVQALTLLRALQRAGADIYYVRDMPKYGSLIFLFCRATGRKIVQALASDAELAPANRDSRLAGWAMHAHSAWRRRADLVIAQTSEQAERLRTRWGISAEVVPSIVPVAAAEPTPRPDPGCFKVLWVGRMAPVKRVDWAAEIARRLPEMEFVIVGGRAREAPEHQAAVGPLLEGRRNVRWLGFVPYPQVAALFQSTHVLLHTSEGGREGFPNVFLQAWAAGLPVVSTGVDPNGLLSQGGLGICTQSVAEAAAAIQHLAADPAQCEAIGRRGRTYVWETHRPEAVMPHIAGLFRKLLESN